MRLDVTQETDWLRAVGFAVKTFGKLNILVNNAGLTQHEGAEALTGEVWDHTIAVNQMGVWLYLASDEASSATDAELFIDGGFTAQ